MQHLIEASAGLLLCSYSVGNNYANTKQKALNLEPLLRKNVRRQRWKRTALWLLKIRSDNFAFFKKKLFYFFLCWGSYFMVASSTIPLLRFPISKLRFYISCLKILTSMCFTGWTQAATDKHNWIHGTVFSLILILNVRVCIAAPVKRRCYAVAMRAPTS